MNGYVEENNSFGFGTESNIEGNAFNYDNISGLGESNYENEDLFSTEVQNNGTQPNFDFIPQTIIGNEQGIGFDVKVPIEQQHINYEPVQEYVEPSVIEPVNMEVSQPTVENTFEVPTTQFEQPVQENVEPSVIEPVNMEVSQPTVENTFEVPVTQFEQPVQENVFGFGDVNEPIITVENQNVPAHAENVNTEFLDRKDSFTENIDNSIDYQVVEPFTGNDQQNEFVVQTDAQPKTVTSEMMSDTPIEELNKLTEYKEEKLNTTDIKALFNRVGVNVQEASDIFMKNTEMKEKIDVRFEELKKLQSEVEQTKKLQYDEINSYKEEVLGKLTEKKEEIEKRINKLKEFQKNLEQEKEEFEKYRKTEKEEIERVQKEVQDAYDSRREELNHIEDVLRKQKDSLDEERNQLSLDRIQYESDKNELANNLLKFNEIVDSFTNGMENVSPQG